MYFADRQGSYTGCHKILFYCEYVVWTENGHIQSLTRFYSILNISCGRTIVICRLSQNSVLLWIYLAERQMYCKYILRTDKGHMQAVTRFYSILIMTCEQTIVISRLSQDSILLWIYLADGEMSYTGCHQILFYCKYVL